MTMVPQLSERKICEAPLAAPRVGIQYYILEDGSGRQSLKGFGVRIGRATKLFVLRHRKRPYVIGEFPEISLRDARAIALQLKADLRGRTATTPTIPHQVLSHTVAQLKERFFRIRILPTRKPRTIQEYERVWKRYLLPRFGRLRLDELTLEMVEDLKIALRAKPVACNRALQQLQAAFNYAVKLRWVPDNVATGCSFYPELPRRRRITPDEYGRIGRALTDIEATTMLQPPSLAVIWTVLLTGCRPFEVRDARLEWCTLDGPSPKIRWPPGTAKGDRDGSARGRTIWLPSAVSHRLRELPRPDGNPYLIPGRSEGDHLKDVGKAWELVLRVAGIESLNLTDVRRSFRSEAPVVGLPREYAAELLGHAPGSKVTDRAYLSFQDHEQHQAAETMGTHLLMRLGAGEENPTAPFAGANAGRLTEPPDLARTDESVDQQSSCPPPAAATGFRQDARLRRSPSGCSAMSSAGGEGHRNQPERRAS